MEFEEFAAKFRERTAARMLEFEQTLARVQNDVEKKAELAEQAAGEKKQEVKTTSSSAARRVPRPVHSVLRRQ